MIERFARLGRSRTSAGSHRLHAPRDPGLVRLLCRQRCAIAVYTALLCQPRRLGPLQRLRRLSAAGRPDRRRMALPPLFCGRNNKMTSYLPQADWRCTPCLNVRRAPQRPAGVPRWPAAGVPGASLPRVVSARLAGLLRQRHQTRWLLADDDPLAFLAGLLALLHAGKQVVIPPSTQPGTLAALADAFDARFDDRAARHCRGLSGPTAARPAVD
jgi:hypothetical protein